MLDRLRRVVTCRPRAAVHRASVEFGPPIAVRYGIADAYRAGGHTDADLMRLPCPHELAVILSRPAVDLSGEVAA